MHFLAQIAARSGPNPEEPSHSRVTRLRFWPVARANLCQQPALSLPSPFAALPHCSAGPAAPSSSFHLQTQSSSKRIGKLFSGVVGEEVGIEVGSTVEAAVVGRRSITIFLGILGIVFSPEGQSPPILATTAASTGSSCSLHLGHTFACAHITSWVSHHGFAFEGSIAAATGSRLRGGAMDRADLGCAHCWTPGLLGTDRPCAAPRMLLPWSIRMVCGWGGLSRRARLIQTSYLPCWRSSRDVGSHNSPRHQTRLPASDRCPAQSRTLPTPSRAMLVSAL